MSRDGTQSWTRLAVVAIGAGAAFGGTCWVQGPGATCGATHHIDCYADEQLFTSEQTSSGPSYSVVGVKPAATGQWGQVNHQTITAGTCTTTFRSCGATLGACIDRNPVIVTCVNTVPKGAFCVGGGTIVRGEGPASARVGGPTGRA